MTLATRSHGHHLRDDSLAPSPVDAAPPDGHLAEDCWRAPTAVPAQAASRAPYCGITWGSLAKEEPGTVGAPPHFAVSARVTTLATTGSSSSCPARQLDLPRRLRTWALLRVDQPRDQGARRCHAGHLDEGAAAHARPRERAGGRARPHDGAAGRLGWHGLRLHAGGGGHAGLGLPFRAFAINDGATSRLVVDIAHRW